MEKNSIFNQNIFFINATLTARLGNYCQEKETHTVCKHWQW